MNNKCNMLILSLLAIKLYRFFLAFFVRFWKQMQCIVSQPLPFLVLQNTYLRVQRYDFMLEYRWKDMLNNNKIAMKIAYY